MTTVVTKRNHGRESDVWNVVNAQSERVIGTISLRDSLAGEGLFLELRDRRGIADKVMRANVDLKLFQRFGKMYLHEVVDSLLSKINAVLEVQE